MKTLFLILALPVLASAQSTAVNYKPQNIVLPTGTDGEKVKDLANEAIRQLVDEFAVQAPTLKAKDSTTQLTKAIQRFAILPLRRDMDDGYLTLQLQNRFTTAGAKAGLELYTRDNTTLNSLLSEIQWGQDFGDTMDTATIQKFGRITGVQAIVFSRFDVTPGKDGAITVRVNMQAYEVETGRTLWGAEKQAEQAALNTLKRAIADTEDFVETVRPYWKTVAIGFTSLIFILWLRVKIRRIARPR